MCGFSGVVHWDGEPVDAAELAAMVGAVRHRGPDALATVRPRPHVGLGHARLRIIDLSEAAAQPMANTQRTAWVVYNGEVYNFRELRAELEASGAGFRSRSDTEVVLRAYEAWGAAAILRLDGMFALAIWDERTQELLLARDRVGKKPLFYWTDGRCLAFGSELKALLPHSHVPRAVREDVLPFVLAFGYPPAGETCFRQIRQVPPASVVRLRAGALGAAERYWELPMIQPQAGLTAARAAGELRQRLEAAVQRRLIADVPIGAWLSGGLDSTIVTGLMAALGPERPVRTFSIGFTGDRRFNETAYAQQAARRFRTQHTVFTVTPQSFELVERLVWHYDQPFGDSSALPTYLLAQRTREHVTVALTGDGGDELFGGYLRFVAAGLAERLPPRLARGVAALLAPVSAGHERTLLARVKRFASAAAQPLPERYLRWTASVADPSEWLVTPDGATLLDLQPALAEWWRRHGSASVLQRLLHFNFRDYLPNDLLVKTDRCSMAHGLETRAPLLDTALIEYVARLPDAFKIRGWRTKVLLRYACADLLPPAIRHRSKMGFGVPLGRWFRGPWREPVHDLLGSPTCLLAQYVRHERVARLLRHHERGVADAGHALWLLLTLEIWLRQLARLGSAQANAVRPAGAGVVS